MFSADRLFPTNPWWHLISAIWQYPSNRQHCWHTANTQVGIFLSTPYRTHICTKYRIRSLIIYLLAARGLTFAQIHRIPCGTAICWVVSVRVFRKLWVYKIFYYLRLIAFLRLPKTVPKSPLGACLKDILRNLQCFEPLTRTPTNRQALKEYQNNLALNNP